MSKFKFLIVTAIVGVALTASSAFAACGDYGPVTLRKGSNGVYVQTLQTQLALTADGAFGPKTEAAVKAFQLGKGLSADGVVGVQTKAALAAACGTTTTPVVTTPVTTTPSLSGDAGDLEVSDTSKDVENDVNEGEEDVNVLGYKVKAVDSDISLTNVKVFLSKNTEAGSERLTRYIDEVKVMLGDEEVGSADASDFSKKSGDPDEFTKSISLKGADVKKGETAYLYIAVSAKSDIDTIDLTADWDVEVQTLRYTDGTGAIMSAAASEIDTIETFGFKDDADSDKLTVKSSSANPAASTISVSNDDETDDVLVGAFKLEADEDSSDISVLELPIKVEVLGNAVLLDSVDEIITELYVKIDGEKFDAELLDGSTDEILKNKATGTVTYIVEFEDDEMVIEADDSVEVKVYASFASMDDGKAYTEGTKIKATLEGEGIEAEGAEEMHATGKFIGRPHTLSSVDLDVKKASSSTSTPTPTYVGDNTYTVEYITKIKVINDGDDDVYIPTTNNALSYILENTSSTPWSGSYEDVSISIEASDSSIEDVDGGYFTVGADSEEEFVVTVVLDNTGVSAGTYRVSIDGIKYGTDSEGSLNSDLTFTAIKSASKYASSL